jgi:hypothetical protein
MGDSRRVSYFYDAEIGNYHYGQGGLLCFGYVDSSRYWVTHDNKQHNWSISKITMGYLISGAVFQLTENDFLLLTHPWLSPVFA